MNRLVIVGAGGFARELHEWVSRSPVWCAKNDIGHLAFVNDDLPEVPLPSELVSSFADFQPSASDLVLVAIGDPSIRSRVTDELLARDARFARFIADGAIASQSSAIGDGTVVCPGTTISPDVRIGSHVQINLDCILAHDVIVGDFATISPNCMLMGGSRVEDLAFLGASTSVAPGRVIGARAFAGIGSVIIRNVGADTRVFGNPASIQERKRP